MKKKILFLHREQTGLDLDLKQSSSPYKIWPKINSELFFFFMTMSLSKLKS